ncbi:hypothetical protein HYC85_024756 [Camellia sinensis]|uniref:Uncharacterized protein n=1 Tax=Camellia sinensis TaxID=4442 RepID=A0A7J7G914_CAMSI|nr:hypothetical protein HYC85_024756 [Camellia sinensis]
MADQHKSRQQSLYSSIFHHRVIASFISSPSSPSASHQPPAIQTDHNRAIQTPEDSSHPPAEITFL